MKMDIIKYWKKSSILIVIFIFCKISATEFLTLAKHVLVLSSIPKSSCPPCEVPFNFSFKGLSELLSSMKKEQSYKPLLFFWQKNQKEILAQSAYLKEFSILLLALYQNLFCMPELRIYLEAKTEITKFFILDLVTVYSKLSALPLTELFFLLEKCLLIYKEILIQQGFPYQKPDQIGAWLETHWWLLPMILVTTWWAVQRWQKNSVTHSLK